MGNNEYGQRKYSLGDGAKRRKKVGTGRKTRTFLLDIWDGLLSVRTSVCPSTSSSLLFAESRHRSTMDCRANNAAVFLFDKRIQLEAIFTVSATARNIVFVLNEIMTPRATR